MSEQERVEPTPSSISEAFSDDISTVLDMGVNHLQAADEFNVKGQERERERISQDDPLAIYFYSQARIEREKVELIGVVLDHLRPHPDSETSWLKVIEAIVSKE